jgi:outer membrane protein assembly factor BamB
MTETESNISPYTHRPLLAVSIFCLLVGAIAADAGAADDWPRWRGTDGSGMVKGATFNPSAISQTPNVRWTAELGKGYSAISVAGPYVYTMGNIDNHDIVYCLREDTGKEVWRHTYKCKAASFPGPRATPCVAGGLVFTMSREGQVYALNAKTGEVIWQRNAAKDVGGEIPKWGLAGSPVLHGDMLLLNIATHGVALNARTGRTLWKSPPGTGGYSTPVVATINGKQTIVLFGEKHAFGVDLRTGRKRFSHPWETAHNVNVADPIVLGNHIFISSGYGHGCALLDVSRSEPKVLWQNTDMRNHFSTSILLDGHLYGVDGNTGKGQLACINAATGSVTWREDLAFGSLIAADGTLIFLNERGSLYAIDASPTACRQVAMAEGVLPRTCWTMPVLCRGSLYLRNEKGRLVCLDVR